jgi:NCS1 family nucleobase:cation symporter-1
VAEQGPGVAAGPTVTAGSAPASDRVGHIEARGVEFVPDADRHGSPRELFGLWMATNLNPINLVLGGLLIILSLNLWQAATAVVLGNTFFALIALAGTAGPRAGTPTLVISRAQYGVHGNKVSAALNLFNLLSFEAINFSLGAFALYALADFAGWEVGIAGKAVLLALVIAVTFVVPFLGHATLVAFQKLFAYALGAVTILLFVFVLPDVNWSYEPHKALSGGAALGTWLVGVTVIASVSISWCAMPADYTRYLPRDASPLAVTAFSALGYWIPGVALGLLAVAAGTAVDMSDPISAMEPLMPRWLYPLFLVVVALGTITNNVVTIYSSGLSLQALGVKIKRYTAVIVNAAVGTAMTVYAVFISNFLDTLTEFLQFMIWWYASFIAIFLVDLALRHRAYDGGELWRGDGPYVYPDGLNWRGIVALGIGTAAAFLFANTAHWKSPISTDYLSGGDLSVLLGLAVGGGLYWLLMRRRHAPQRASLERPKPAVAALTSHDPRH